jgi:starvation-inducible DNA-binding protein
MPSTRTFTTRIDLPAAVRDKVIPLLNQQLADTFDLYSQIKQAHWNVKGPQFIQLHELFDKLAGEVLEGVDLIAERATALGGTALGTARMAAQGSRLPEFPSDVFAGAQAVAALAERFAAVAKSTRTAMDTTSEWGDATTTDLLTEISRGLDKSLWFLEAHLQA